MTLAAITTLPKTTHNISTFNMDRTLSNCSKTSCFLHINCFLETFIDSHNRFIQDPGFKPWLHEKETPTFCTIFN